NFVVVAGDGTKYSFENAKLGYNTKTTSCSAGGGACSDSYSFVSSLDYLVDFDTLSATGGLPNFNPGSGQGVMLDLTQAVNGNGTAIVRFRDGSQILFPVDHWFGIDGSVIVSASGALGTAAASVVDSNGNVISFNSDNTISDTLGRKITIAQNGSGVSYQDSNGNNRTIGFRYSQFPVSWPFPTFTTPATNSSLGIDSVGTTPIGSMLSSIVLPDGLSYTFQYNEYGEIVEITYPSGGYSRYGYQAITEHNFYSWTTSVQGSADNREVIDKFTCPAVAVTAGETAPSGYVGASASNTCPVAENHTHYERPTGNLPTYPITVTDPNGNQTIYGGATSAFSYGNGGGARE